LKKVVCLQRKEKREKRQTFQVVAKVRSWKFWYWLSEICEENMEDVMEKMKEGQDVETCWRVLKKSIVDVLEIGRKKAKRKKEEEGDELREMKKELETLKKEKRCAQVEQKRFKC